MSWTKRTLQAVKIRNINLFWRKGSVSWILKLNELNKTVLKTLLKRTVPKAREAKAVKMWRSLVKKVETCFQKNKSLNWSGNMTVRYLNSSKELKTVIIIALRNLILPLLQSTKKMTLGEEFQRCSNPARSRIHVSWAAIVSKRKRTIKSTIPMWESKKQTQTWASLMWEMSRVATRKFSIGQLLTFRNRFQTLIDPYLLPLKWTKACVFLILIQKVFFLSNCSIYLWLVACN